MVPHPRSKKWCFAFQTFTETPPTTPSILGFGITHQPHEGGDGAKCGAKFADTPHVIYIEVTGAGPERKDCAEIAPNKFSAKQPRTQCTDTATSYYEDVEGNQEFSSCCGPGEWAVCNCLSEGYELAERQLATDNVTDSATPLEIGSDSTLVGFSALATSAIAMHEVFLGFVAAGFTEDQALKIITGLLRSD